MNIYMYAYKYNNDALCDCERTITLSRLCSLATMSPSHLRPTPLAQMHAEIPFSRPSTPPPEHAPLQIGFCGLGAMGYIMARNLANHLHSHPEGAPPLLVYNRTRAKSEKLESEVGPNKVRIAESAMQVARECDVIITILANDTAVKSVYTQFKQALSVCLLSLFLCRLLLTICRTWIITNQKYSWKVALVTQPLLVGSYSSSIALSNIRLWYRRA